MNDLKINIKELNVKYFFDILGSYAPYILLVVSIFLLRNLKHYLIFYIFGIFINNLINIILKLLIKEPRPEDDIKNIELMILNGKRVGYDKYGMPSGHAQNCLFSLVYVTLVLNQPSVTLLYVIASTVSLIQRYEYNNHTIMQLIVGSVVGILFAHVVYFFAGKYINGKMSKKKDDEFFGNTMF